MPKTKAKKRKITRAKPAKTKPLKKVSEPKKISEYTAKQIMILEGLEPVQKRPAMYIGSTSADGLHHLVWEVIDNAIDEAMAGYCNEIWVRLLPNHTVEVIDNGRGIPVDIHKPTKKSALEIVMTKLHAGGKFGQESAYKVSGGLHGVGVSAVNALSEYCRAEVKRDGKLWVQEYIRGKPSKKVKAIGKAKGTGTTITFRPDPKIFSILDFNLETILNHLRQQAYLTKGVKIILEDKRSPQNKFSYTFYFEGGIASYIQYLNLNNELKQENIFYVEKEVNGVKVEIALQYTNDYKETVFAFANNILNTEGGTHLVGFRTGLTRTLNNYSRKQGYLKEKEENLTGEDVREGLAAIVSIKVKEPQFEGQTKARLGNAEVKSIVDSVLSETFLAFLEEHPKDAEAIIGKCVLAQKARIAAKTARETVLRRGVLEGLTLPGKLADCSSRDSQNTELYIVEGDSAGGCFSEDVMVALTDGRSLNFKELVAEWEDGKTNYCYTIKPDGNIGIEKILYPRVTRKNARVMKVVLDNDKEITCTPYHKFMLKDGSYLRANDLKPEISLMPLGRKLSEKKNRITIEGYEMLFNPKTNGWVFTHLLADRYNIENNIYDERLGKYKHHTDFNKLNNNPNNIIRMTGDEHLEIHRKQVALTLHRKEVIEKCNKIKRSSEYRNKISGIMKERLSNILSARAKKQWKDLKYKKYMRQKYLQFYHSNESYRRRILNIINKAQREYWKQEQNRKKQSQRVKEYFKKYPEMKEHLSKKAKKQWQNRELLEWRRRKTNQQWSQGFREKRKEAYNRTYLKNSMKFLKEVYEKCGNINFYDQERKGLVKRNNNLLRLNTLLERFFNNDKKQLLEAVKNFNHKVKKIEFLTEGKDVYDLEVPNTHNFALSNGVFVHNSAKQGRNREFQAILPLRGKILNVERARIDKMLANNEIKSLIIALGTNLGEQFDLKKLRYNRIIIMTDADVDGAHIRTLLLTMFYRYFPEIIKNRHLYIAQPPLYRIQCGKEVEYVYSDQELEKIREKLQKIKKEKRVEKKKKTKEISEEKEIKLDIQRYKGLGEMNPVQLWETTMNPENRMMKQVTIEDAQKTDEIFEILMGSEVEPRKNFIQTHAKAVKNLDI